jgi:hypothetical protein
LKLIIHLPVWMRDPLKKNISVFVKTYLNKIVPVFYSIEEESHEAEYVSYADMGNFFDPARDNAFDFAERASEHGMEYFESMSLMKYNSRLMSLATLYQFWEQQVRKLAFEEFRRNLSVSEGRPDKFNTFYTRGINDIKDLLLKCGVDITLLGSWAKIDELRILQNVIKHVEGKFGKSLEDLRPDYFMKTGTIRDIDLYFSTLTHIVLNIEDSEIREYGDALIEFWDELPENMYQTN